MFIAKRGYCLKWQFWRKAFASVAIISLLANSFLPYSAAAIIYAQESTESATQESLTPSETPLPSDSPTISPSPDPTPSITPEPTAIPTPTEEVTPTPEPTIIAPTPTEVIQPTETGPPVTPTPEQGEILDGASTESASISQEKMPLRIAGDFQKNSNTLINKNYVEGEVIVKFKTDKLDVKSTFGKVQAFVFEKKFSLEKRDEIKTSNIQVFKSKQSTEEMVKELKSDPNVEYVQPNYIYEPSAIGTNDTHRALLWGLENTAQTVPGTYSPNTGTIDKDIDAPEAWGISQGNGTIVAIIDSGVAYNHPDLVNNMWDGSLCKDENNSVLGGCNSGYDYEDNDKIPLPTSSSHGTHIAGIIAAEINNGKGVIGVSPKTKIMAIKTSLTTTEIVKGISFAQYNGAKIINASWGNNDVDSVLLSAISGFNGLFIAAAGNGGNDGIGDNNEITHFYPSDYNLDNIISVAATDQNDNLADFSDYGATSVDIGAPGTNIYSTTADANLLNETFESLTPPTVPSGWVKTGNWGTYNLGGDFWGKVLYGDVYNVPYAENANSSVTTSSYNLSGLSGTTVEFWARCDTANDGGDYMALEVSGGGAYQELGRWNEYDTSLPYDYVSNDSVFTYVHFIKSIPQEYFSSTTSLRFSWHTDGDALVSDDGCLVDGINITKYSDGSDESYGYMNGTSMATPHVAGLAALLWGYKPSLTLTQIKDRILQTGDSVSSLSGKTVTGKRINAYNALSGLNNSPATNNGSATTNEDTAKTVTLSGSDVDGDSLTYSVVSNPTHGTLSTVTGNQVTYTPSTNYVGSDSFTFKANDGLSDSNTSTISITVTVINDTPVANNGSVSTSEDTAVEITLSGSDVDGDPLTYEKVTETSSGTLSAVSGNKVTYTPSSNYVGSDSFTFKVKDGSLYSTPATVSITITTVNDPPVLNPIGNKSVNELTNLTFTVTATDPDSTVSYSLTGAPTGATIGSSTGVFSFTPTEAQGPGSYTVTINATDGTLTDSETITITVNEVNVAPVPHDATVTTDEDTAKIITLSATDSDLPVNTLTYLIVDNPIHGTIFLIGDKASYTPSSNYNGSDSFTFKVNDGTVDSVTKATISITITAINDTPVITTTPPTTATEDSLYVYDADVSDPDGPSAVWSKTGSDTCGGTLDSTTGIYTFTPAGPTPLTSCVLGIKVTDGGTPNLSDTQTVTITINAVNNKPVAVADSYATNEDITLTIVAPGVLTNDTDADSPSLSVVQVSDVSHGVLTLNANGSFVYVPTSNYNGSDSFTYKANDSTDDSNIASVNITINSVNDAPVASNDTASVDEDTTLTVAKSSLLANDTDAEGGSLNITAVSNPTHGSTSIAGDNIVFTPTANYNGSASFDYTISDGSLTNTATVTVTVNPINDSPAFDSISNKTVNEDSSSQNVSITNISPGPADEAGQTVSMTATSSDTSVIPNPTISGSGTTRTLVYAPVANMYGSATITVTADDGQTLNNSFSRTFTINVTAVNDAPSITSITDKTINEDTSTGSLAFTIGDVDNPLGSLAVTGVSSNTSVVPVSDIVFGGSGADRTITVTPLANQSGTTTITITVSDGTATTSTSFILTVTAVNDSPTISNITNKTINEDNATSAIPFTIGDADNPVASLTITKDSSNTALVPNANITFGGSGTDRTITVTPLANQSGTTTITITVSDGTATTSTSFILTVTAVNDVPVANGQSVTTMESVTKEITLSGSDLDGDVLNYFIVTPPTHGTLDAITDGIVHYTPNTNYMGTDSFTFRVSDGTEFSSPATVSITITEYNDPPVLDPIGNKTVDELTNLTFTVSATDPDDTPTFGMTNAPTGATLNTSTGVFSWTPTEVQGPGSYPITINATDGTSTDSETITITVNEVNTAPTANNVSVATLEDTTKNITLSATDSDIPVQGINYFLTSNPTNGTLDAITDGKINYTPNTNYFGSDSFTYKVNDGVVDSIDATVTITVTAVNDSPTISNITNKTINEDNATSAIPFTIGDADNPVASLTITKASSNTALVPNANITFGGSGTDRTITVTPLANQSGTTTITITVSDGTATTSTSFILTVTAVNDAPTAINNSYTTSEDTTLTIPASGILANDTDLENDVLSVVIDTSASHGSLTLGEDGSFTYTPSVNFNGPDAFTYKVTDGNLTSESATVTITVTPVNDAPVAVNDSAITAEDTVLTIAKLTLLANDTDVDGDTLTITVVSNPIHGTVAISGSVVQFTPTVNYNGTAVFGYTISDGTLTDTGAVTVTITPVNDAPVANGQSVTTSEDTTATITLSGTDVDEDALNYFIVTPPTHGTLDAITDGIVHYTPNTNYAGSDAFTFRVKDGSEYSAPATVTITVAAVDDPPILATIGNKTVDELVNLTFTATATDLDSAVTYSLTSAPTGATIGSSTGEFSWTPTEAQGPGSYTLTVNATDGTSTSSETITITVNEVNIAPKANAVTVSTLEDTTKNITLSATDADLPTQGINYFLTSNPTNGTLDAITDGKINYTPSYNYNGSDSFTYKTNDGTADSNEATVTITVTAVNDAPVANADTLSVNEDIVLTVTKSSLLANDTDVDGDTLTITSVSNSIHGIVAIVGSNVTFTPISNYNGPASFDYTISDGTLTDTTTVSITVNPVNDSPVANDGSVITSQDDPVTIDLKANDVDGDTLTYMIVSSPVNGTVGVVTGNQITYTPSSSYSGADSFTFKANDGTVDSNISTVSITINPPPVISNEDTNTISESGVNITWTTDHPSTSRVIYDTVSHEVLDIAPNYGYTNSTVETDNNPKVISHSVTISGLTPGTTYYYRSVSHGSPEVVSEEKSFTTTTSSSNSNNSNNSSSSTTNSASAPVCNDTKPGSAPTLITAIAGVNSVTLIWSAALTPVSYYLVTYGTGPGLQQYGNPNIGGVGTTSYTVKGLSGGTTYYFKIRAGNGCTPGDYSNELSAIPGGEFISAPASGFISGVLGTTTENDSTPSPTPQNVLGTQGSMQKPWWSFFGEFFGTIIQWLNNIFRF